MEGGSQLCGLIYLLPPISSANSHLFQASMNFNMFQKMFGSDAMQNVLFLSHDTHSPCTFLSADFLPLSQQGFRPIYCNRSRSTVHSSIRTLVQFAPRALRIQRELLEHGLDITRTCAYAELMTSLALEERYYQQALNMYATDGQAGGFSDACCQSPLSLVAYMRRATCSRLTSKLMAVQFVDTKLSLAFRQARTFWKVQVGSI